MLIAGIFQVYIFLGRYSILYFAILVGLLVGIFLMPIIYYPIRALLKKEVLAASITIYYIVVIIAYLVEYSILKDPSTLAGLDVEVLSFCLIIALIIFYAVLTFLPPKWGIFKDTITKKYGDFK
jgi:hypothetical protein